MDASVNIELGNNPAPQLYDLSVDIGETHNVASEHPDVVRRLDALLREVEAARQTRPAATAPAMSTLPGANAPAAKP